MYFAVSLNLTDGADLQERRKYTMLDIGYWSPQDGFMLTDALFPHTQYGFRGVQLIFYSYHVRSVPALAGVVLVLYISIFFNLLLQQNPPWQFVAYNDSGSPVISSGVVYDILNELSRKLNFTYTMVISQPAEINGSLVEGNTSVSVRHSITPF